MFKCLTCGQDLGWIGDFTTEEVYGEEREGVVGIYGCGNCKLDYEITTYCENDEFNSDIFRIHIYETEE